MCNLLVTALIIAFLLIMSENVELNPELRSWVQLDSIVLCTHPNARFGALVDDLRGETEGLVTDFQIHSHYGVLPLKAYRNMIPTYSGFVDACVTFTGIPSEEKIHAFFERYFHALSFGFKVHPTSGSQEGDYIESYKNLFEQYLSAASIYLVSTSSLPSILTLEADIGSRSILGWAVR